MASPAITDLGAKPSPSLQQRAAQASVIARAERKAAQPEQAVDRISQALDSESVHTPRILRALRVQALKGNVPAAKVWNDAVLVPLRESFAQNRSPINLTAVLVKNKVSVAWAQPKGKKAARKGKAQPVVIEAQP